MSKTFTVKVRGKIAAAEYTEPYVCDNSDYEIEFDFSEEWQVYELKTARFAYGGKMQDIIFEGSRCGVPRMSGICSFKVGVFAGDLSTTTPAYIEARASILSEGGTPTAPAPDVYDQLMQRMNEIEAPEAVLYTEQILTDEQKAQARANINADRFEVEIYRDRGTPYSDKTAKEIYDAFASGKTVEIAVDLVRAMLTECRMQNDKYYISCYVPRVTEAYTVVGLGSYMLYLDGVLGTARGIWKQGLYNVTATAELAPITGVVTADKLFDPDHPTDLVSYEAFTVAVPLVQSMDITGAQVGQTIKVKAVNKQGMPTAWEAADMSADEQWELLGTLDASTGDVLQLDFSNPVKKLYFYSSLCDTAGEQYGASTTVYRQVAFKVGDTWRDVNSFKIGCCKHNWCWRTRYWLECGANLPYPKGEWTETLSAGNAAIKLTPLVIGNNNQYSSGLVSGIRFSLVLPDGTENTASGTIKVWGVKA